jgi:hypothetical protein
MLSVILLNVGMLSVDIVSVVMPSVVASNKGHTTFKCYKTFFSSSLRLMVNKLECLWLKSLA